MTTEIRKYHPLNDKLLHCADGPAVVYPDGKEEYWLVGAQLSEREVALFKKKKLKYRLSDYYIEFGPHRDGGYHREDGPAFSHIDGFQAWWLNLKRHNVKGPAIISGSGTTSKYWLDGRKITKEEWEKDPRVAVSREGRSKSEGSDGFGKPELIEAVEKKDNQDRLHNLEGPARTVNGKPEYWIWGEQLTDEEWEAFKTGKPTADRVMVKIFGGSLVQFLTKDGLTYRRKQGPANLVGSQSFKHSEYHWDYKIVSKEKYQKLLQEDIDFSAPLEPPKPQDQFTYFPGTQLLHNYDGPAVIRADGTKEYYFFGEPVTPEEWDQIQKGEILLEKGSHHVNFLNKERRYHRNKGPSYITSSGQKNFWRNGNTHRLDGPAIFGEYRIYGRPYNKEDYEKCLAIYNDPKHATPSKILEDDTKVWLSSNKKHRIDGPAVVKPNGTLEYWIYDQSVSAEEWKQVENGEIVIEQWDQNSVQFKKNGKNHRDNGPSWIKNDGALCWEKYGQEHREDGPSFIFSNGNCHYGLCGIKYSKEEWEIKIRKIQKLKPEVPLEGAKFPLEPPTAVQDTPESPKTDSPISVDISPPSTTESLPEILIDYDVWRKSNSTVSKVSHRVLAKQAEPILQKMVGNHHLTKNLLRYCLGYTAQELHPQLAKQFRVEALTGLGEDFLDQIAGHVQETLKKDPISTRQLNTSEPMPEQVVLQEICYARAT